MDYRLSIDEFNEMVNKSLKYSNFDFNFDIRKCESFTFNTAISCEVIINDIYLFIDTIDFIINGKDLFKDCDEIYFDLDYDIQRRIVDELLEKFNYAGALLNCYPDELNKLIFNNEFLKLIEEKDFIINQTTLVGQDT